MNLICFYLARRILGVVAVGLQWRDNQREARRIASRAHRIAQARRMHPQPGDSLTHPTNGPRNGAQEAQP